MAVRGPAYADVRSALQAQYGVLVAALSGMDPQGPTDCEAWTVEDLETHLALTARDLARSAGRDVDGRADGGGVNCWAEQLPGFAEQLDARTKAERLPLAPQAGLVAEVLASHPADKVVEQLTGRHTLKDASLFRLIEAVVHGLDVGIAPAAQALRIVVQELARALADRCPGRSVEVRIPPYAAVQCLEGPRHTRGTPPNVVEAEPVAWVRLCTGRERWDALIGAGRITASGERADLSPYLPLLS
ncbi:MAG: hypothetical protein JWM02_2288 [Frankiales bacterium]|nr:hypothetical protein [Frankiales bacterium]